MVKLIRTPIIPKVIFTSSAFAKLRLSTTLPHAKTYEYMFLGQVEKAYGDFIISDIHFAPQENKNTTVTTKDEEYPEWLTHKFPNPKDRKTIRLHGHSHVNMTTTPSSTDMDMMATILKGVSDFFIQLIINLNNKYTINIYDIERNLLFEDVEMYVSIGETLVKIGNISDTVILDVTQLPKDKFTRQEHLIFFNDNIALDLLRLRYILKDSNIYYNGTEYKFINETKVMEELTIEASKTWNMPSYVTNIKDNSPMPFGVDDSDFVYDGGSPYSAYGYHRVPQKKGKGSLK